jgi:hypothetical protein
MPNDTDFAEFDRQELLLMDAIPLTAEEEAWGAQFCGDGPPVFEPIHQLSDYPGYPDDPPDPDSLPDGFDGVCVEGSPAVGDVGIDPDIDAASEVEPGLCSAGVIDPGAGVIRDVDGNVIDVNQQPFNPGDATIATTSTLPATTDPTTTLASTSTLAPTTTTIQSVSVSGFSVFVGGSGVDGLSVAGSGATFGGRVVSNGGVRVRGAGHKLIGGVSFVSTLDVGGAGSVVSPAGVKGAATAVSLDRVASFAPGSPVALAVARYTAVSASMCVNGVWSPKVVSLLVLCMCRARSRSQVLR